MSEHAERVNPATRHACCDACWQRAHPHREPVRARDEEPPVPCCFCACTTGSGITVRHDRADVYLFCNGLHPEE